jgi:Coenzyme PQQ synthesis protein D (PqqD)
MVSSPSERPASVMRLVVPDSIMSRAVDTSTILLDVVSGRTLSLDDVATEVWATLTDTATIADTVARLSSKYDAPPGVIEHDVTALVDTLLDAGFVAPASR